MTRLALVAALLLQGGMQPMTPSLMTSQHFEVTAAYGALVEDWARAARFFGIAEGQIALTGYQRDPADEAFLKPFVERARVALGPPVFGDTQQAARALTYEQALGEVREWLRCG